MDYGDYIGNIARVAAEVANEGGVRAPSSLVSQMFDEHGVTPGEEDLGGLAGLVRDALGRVVDGAGVDAVNTLLHAYPPDLHLSAHDGRPHIHFARDGSSAEIWLGQTIAAALAHVAAGDPGVTLGRCVAEGCGRYFVDQSRNRTRRFCGNACASRTTVAAHRARAKR